MKRTNGYHLSRLAAICAALAATAIPHVAQAQRATAADALMATFREACLSGGAGLGDIEAKASSLKLGEGQAVGSQQGRITNASGRIWALPNKMALIALASTADGGRLQRCSVASEEALPSETRAAIDAELHLGAPLEPKDPSIKVMAWQVPGIDQRIVMLMPANTPTGKGVMLTLDVVPADGKGNGR